MANKIMSTFRLTPLAKQIIERLVTKLGVSQAAVVEIAVRQLGKKEGIEINDATPPDTPSD